MEIFDWCVRLDMESIHVLLGGHDLENVKEEELELRAVVRMVKHPKFEPKTFNNDIAILQFDEPIPFSRLIGPVCLPQSGKSLQSEWQNVGLDVRMFYSITWNSFSSFDCQISSMREK